MFPLQKPNPLTWATWSSLGSAPEGRFLLVWSYIHSRILELRAGSCSCQLGFPGLPETTLWPSAFSPHPFCQALSPFRAGAVGSAMEGMVGPSWKAGSWNSWNVLEQFSQRGLKNEKSFKVPSSSNHPMILASWNTKKNILEHKSQISVSKDLLCAPSSPICFAHGSQGIQAVLPVLSTWRFVCSCVNLCAGWHGRGPDLGGLMKWLLQFVVSCQGSLQNSSGGQEMLMPLEKAVASFQSSWIQPGTGTEQDWEED